MGPCQPESNTYVQPLDSIRFPCCFYMANRNVGADYIPPQPYQWDVLSRFLIIDNWIKNFISCVLIHISVIVLDLSTLYFYKLFLLFQYIFIIIICCQIFSNSCLPHANLFFYLKFFHIFDHISSSLQTPISFQPTYPPNFIFFLSQNKNKNKNSKTK